MHEIKRVWTEFEDRELKRMHEAGKSTKEIASALSRTATAVCARLSKTGVRRNESLWIGRKSLIHHPGFPKQRLCGNDKCRRAFMAQHAGVTRCDRCRSGLSEGMGSSVRVWL